MTTLVWFRQDLRLADNPALCAALAGGGPVVALYLHAPGEEAPWAAGGAARWWLHHSLANLDASLRRCGSRLCLRACEDSLAALRAVAREVKATRVVWNRRYEPAIVSRDRHIKTQLLQAGLEAVSYNSALLFEPWTISNQSDGPFQVFGAYWRRCLSLEDPPAPLPAPAALPAPAVWPDSQALGELALLPDRDWTRGLDAAWSPGSDAAQAQLEEFLRDGIDEYDHARDHPGRPGTSRLSPHLHFGEIGPRQIWHAVRSAAARHGQHSSWRTSRFLTEIGWREFAHHLLYHFPLTPGQPLRPQFAQFPWATNALALRAWQRGRTGYPLIDAGMRELWHTGWMHNRVRMAVASFLVKDLLLPWTEGARWFWDTLVDADLASNTLGWQWVAGCGADAAPFFRIFNPVTQGTKFDADGSYVRRWVPELAALPDAWLQCPWEAPAEVLRSAGIALGTDYPKRLVAHDAARQMALQAYAAVKHSKSTR
jgi:deoxyribodipyrimidine photo-lyase